MSPKPNFISRADQVAVFAAFALVSGWGGSAAAQPVLKSRGLAAWTEFAGCAAPTDPTGRHFFLDPVRGDLRNDGSARHPWPGLGQALSAREADLRPGDTLVLMSGNHGDVSLKKINAAFVRVEPAAGARPVLRHVSIVGAKWMLVGLSFENDHRGALVVVSDAAHDIVIEKNRFLSAEDAKGWTPQELADKGATGIYTDGRGGARCLTIRDNTMLYVDYGARLTVDKTVFAGNTIDRFGGDAVDYHGSDLNLSFNTITNAREVRTGEHIDAMQGWTPGGQGWDPKSNTHVTIEGNLVIRQVDPELAYPAGMQGIDAFDGDWTDLRVVNNVVITNAFHGIYFASVHRGLIANNTVISDEHPTLNHPPAPSPPVVLTGERVWLGVGDKTHQGTASNDVVIRNNIAQSMQLNSSPNAVKVDHNQVYHLWYQGQQGDPHPISATGAADMGNHNRVDPGLTRGFRLFDPKSFRFDLHLKTGSRAIGAGTPLLAPATDFEGVHRDGATDLGAYLHNKIPG